MNRSRIIPVVAAVVLAGFLALFSTTSGFAQQAVPGMKRTMLDKQDLSVPGREGVLVEVEFAPSAKEANHTHPGDLFAYVLDGSPTLAQEGKPTAHLKTGESFFIPAGKVHAVSNEGTTTAKLLVTFFVEKGKPLMSPVQ